MSLRLIASYDDLIKLCNTDTSLADRFSDNVEKREITFDPVMSCASNPDLLSKGHFFSRNGKACKRSLNSFDEDKYTKLFIKNRLAHLNAKVECKKDEKCPEGECKCEKPEGIKRNGFDAYKYLMSHEKEIREVYKMRNDVSLLQKAALYFIETGSEESELNCLKYVASHDNLASICMKSKPASKKDVKEWIEEFGKKHYELNENKSVDDLFNVMAYVASYPKECENLTSEDGSYDAEKVMLHWITDTAPQGLQRNQFAPMVYLANNPDLCKEDIYTESNEIDETKVAKLWIKNFDDGIELDKFDVEDYKESHELENDDDAFSSFVNEKVQEYLKELKESKSLQRKVLKLLPSLKLPSLIACGSRAIQNTVESPVESEAKSKNESEPEQKAEKEIPEPKVEKKLTTREIKKQLKDAEKQLKKENLKKQLEEARKKLAEMSN